SGAVPRALFFGPDRSRRRREVAESRIGRREQTEQPQQRPDSRTPQREAATELQKLLGSRSGVSEHVEGRVKKPEQGCAQSARASVQDDGSRPAQQASVIPF